MNSRCGSVKCPSRMPGRQQVEGDQEGRRLASPAKPAARRQGGRHSVRAPLEPACNGDVNCAVTKRGPIPSGSLERQGSGCGCDAPPAGSTAGGIAAGGADETSPDEQPEQPAPEQAELAQAVHPPPLRQQPQPQPAARGAQPQLPSAAAEPAKQQPKRRRRLGANRALAASPEPEDDYGPQRRPRG